MERKPQEMKRSECQLDDKLVVCVFVRARTWCDTEKERGEEKQGMEGDKYKQRQNIGGLL